MQTALNVFLLPGTQEGIAVNIVMSFIFVKIQGTFQPYLGWEEDFLGEMAQWLILIQLQVTLLLSTEIVSPYGPIGVMFFLLSGSVISSVLHETKNVVNLFEGFELFMMSRFTFLDLILTLTPPCSA